MTTVAVLLLPLAALLLWMMDRLEDRLGDPPVQTPARHARRRRHLRLVPHPTPKRGRPHEVAADGRWADAA
ncbi:hypothetical protein [Streptomyces sp. ODS05-4]|uniref:hypothetical protein n=1 Tax=Streptomyces sp. ODS05-4 TaxID=2944939 RepID=UPI00210C4CBF|nr:hypothetical protein [Streptomyces sp. ODS05-4]